MGYRVRSRVPKLRFCFRSRSPCIMCVQYIGGCSVHRRISVHRGDTMSTSGGYHEYIGGGGAVQYIGGYHDACGDVQYIGGYHECIEGYHEYIRGIS